MLRIGVVLIMAGLTLTVIAAPHRKPELPLSVTLSITVPVVGGGLAKAVW